MIRFSNFTLYYEIFSSIKSRFLIPKILSFAVFSGLEELDELTSRPVEHKRVKDLRDRVTKLKYREDIFTYLDNPKVEPTNNIAERLLKVAARLRDITYGSRSVIEKLRLSRLT